MNTESLDYKDKHLILQWFEQILGIDRKNGTYRLVKHFHNERQQRAEAGPDAEAILQTFLNLVWTTLDERARFNRVR